MAKKIIIGVIVVLAIILILMFAGVFKSGQNTGTPGTTPQVSGGTETQLDDAIKAQIEILKPTCVTFLTGDLSGKPSSDCPGFDQPINRNLCYYCYAVKNNTPNLCQNIDLASGLRTVCQGATGSTTDQILNK